MELFENLLLVETQRRSKQEVDNAIRVINQIYKEWKYKKRRKNAVDLITTSVNKISNLDPSLVDHIHEAGKLKLCAILMRCMDNPVWKPLEVKKKIYRKLYPLIDRLQSFSPETTTGACLREVIMTRLSACLSYQEECEPGKRIFVAYEPKIPTRYLKYIFGDALPCKTYRMQMLMLPEDYDTLIEVLTINHEKCRTRFSECED